MAERARFRADFKGIGAILRSPQMQQEMAKVARGIKAKAEATSPRHTGQYGASFRVEVGVRGGRKSRAQAKVVNDAPNAPYVEWGTSKTPRYRVMGRAAGAE